MLLVDTACLNKFIKILSCENLEKCMFATINLA
jgi:hypothetical protein